MVRFHTRIVYSLWVQQSATAQVKPKPYAVRHAEPTRRSHAKRKVNERTLYRFFCVLFPSKSDTIANATSSRRTFMKHLSTPSLVCKSTNLSSCLFVCLFVCPFVNSARCLPISPLSDWLSACLCVCLFLCFFVCLPILCSDGCFFRSRLAFSTRY